VETSFPPQISSLFHGYIPPQPLVGGLLLALDLRENQICQPMMQVGMEDMVPDMFFKWNKAMLKMEGKATLQRTNISYLGLKK